MYRLCNNKTLPFTLSLPHILTNIVKLPMRVSEMANNSYIRDDFRFQIVNIKFLFIIPTATAYGVHVYIPKLNPKVLRKMPVPNLKYNSCSSLLCSLITFDCVSFYGFPLFNIVCFSIFVIYLLYDFLELFYIDFRDISYCLQLDNSSTVLTGKVNVILSSV